MHLTTDLHIYAHYSQATSKNLDFEHLAQWAQRKGVHIVGTGDISHQAKKGNACIRGCRRSPLDHVGWVQLASGRDERPDPTHIILNGQPRIPQIHGPLRV